MSDIKESNELDCELIAGISQRDLIAMFGKTMPSEAVELIWYNPEKLSAVDIKSALEKIANTQGLKRDLLKILSELRCFMQLHSMKADDVTIKLPPGDFVRLRGLIMKEQGWDSPNAALLTTPDKTLSEWQMKYVGFLIEGTPPAFGKETYGTIDPKMSNTEKLRQAMRDWLDSDPGMPMPLPETLNGLVTEAQPQAQAEAPQAD